MREPSDLYGNDDAAASELADEERTEEAIGDDLEMIESLELDYLKALNAKDLAEEKIAELREELKGLVGKEGFEGRHLNMTWVTSRGATDWKKCVEHITGGDKDTMDELAEEYRKAGSTKFTVTSNKKGQKK